MSKKAKKISNAERARRKKQAEQAMVSYTGEGMLVIDMNRHPAFLDTKTYSTDRGEVRYHGSRNNPKNASVIAGRRVIAWSKVKGKLMPIIQEDFLYLSDGMMQRDGFPELTHGSGFRKTIEATYIGGFNGSNTDHISQSIRGLLLRTIPLEVELEAENKALKEDDLDDILKISETEVLRELIVYPLYVTGVETVTRPGSSVPERGIHFSLGRMLSQTEFREWKQAIQQWAEAEKDTGEERKQMREKVKRLTKELRGAMDQFDGRFPGFIRNVIEMELGVEFPMDEETMEGSTRL